MYLFMFNYWPVGFIYRFWMKEFTPYTKMCSLGFKEAPRCFQNNAAAKKKPKYLQNALLRALNGTKIVFCSKFCLKLLSKCQNSTWQGQNALLRALKGTTKLFFNFFFKFYPKNTRMPHRQGQNALLRALDGITKLFF